MMQNSTDLDRKVDKYFWWRAAAATTTKIGRKGNDLGPTNVWSTTDGKLVGFSRLQYSVLLLYDYIIQLPCSSVSGDQRLGGKTTMNKNYRKSWPVRGESFLLTYPSIGWYPIKGNLIYSQLLKNIAGGR